MAHEGGVITLKRIAVGAVVAAAVTTVWTAATSGSIAAEHGCAYDGESYCAMASGRRGAKPYNHRVLEPAVVRVLHVGSVTARFRAVDVGGVVLMAVVTAVLTRRIAGSAGASASRVRAAGAIGAAVAVLVPTSLHLAVFLPVQTDLLATALGMGCLVALLDCRPTAQYAAAAIGGLAVLTREAWFVPLLVAAAIVAPRRRRPAMLLACVSGCAAVAAFAQPAAGHGTSVRSYATTVVHAYVRSPSELAIVIWLALVPTGAAALLAIRAMRGAAGSTLPKDALVARVCLAVSAVHLLQGLVGGSDVSRIAGPAAPLLWAVALGAAAPRRSADLDVAVALTGSLLLWRPLHVLGGSTTQYLGFFMPQFTGTQGHVVRLTILVWAGVAAACLAGERRSRHAAAVLDLTACP